MRASALRRVQSFQRTPVNRAQKAGVQTYPSPIGGWNARDSLDEMEPTDAVALDNWFPGFGSCSIRGGSTPFASSLNGSVRMLAEFFARNLRKFIAGAGGRIWDISSAGAGVSLASGFLADTWETAQFDDASGGPRMGLVNGSDAPQQYDGTAVSAMTISGTGLTPSNLNGIHVHKSRSYFWDDRTQDFWYSATNALGGVLTKFPLGRTQVDGGNMLAMGTWSRDSGNGPQDLAVFVLSSGDVIVYAGDNPGDAAAWSLVGRYSIGAPISKRGLKKIGADLVLVTKAGYVSLASVFNTGRFNEQSASISSKIRGAVLQATRSYATNSGWELALYPRGNMLIANVPITATASIQHVMNTETKAWCRFTGLNATCWGLYNDQIYFGTPSGSVSLADTGYGDSGAAVIADGQTAWNYLEDRTRSKRGTAIMARLRTTGALPYQIGAGWDFNPVILGTTINVGQPPTISPWDVSPWDVSPWSDETVISNEWTGLADEGYVISSRLRIASLQGCEWFSMSYLTEPGGIF